MSGTLLETIPAVHKGLESLGHQLGHSFPSWVQHSEHLHVLPSILYGVVVVFAVVLAVVAKGRFAAADAVIPDDKLTIRTFFELFLDTVMGIMIPIMGEKNSKRFLPLIGSCAVIIFFSNFFGLIPGMIPPTENLSVNFAMGLVIFLATHVAGVQTNGIHHFAHMANPVGAWWGWFLAPIMLPIELISHIVRPVSLSLRLMGNMIGDHKVLGIFLTLVPLVVPMPFLLLGSIVCTVQTVVFCLLSMVYIGMALEEQHHESSEGHEQHH